MWEDYAITIGTLLFNIALIPQLLFHWKTKTCGIRSMTATLYTIGAYLFIVAFASLHLSFSFWTGAFSFICWGIICGQSYLYTSNKFSDCLPTKLYQDKWDNMVRSMKGPRGIASALSRICRWGGRGQVFYAVLPHSIVVSRMVSSAAKPYAMLHDAHEGLSGDCTRPCKSKCQYYIEGQLQKIVYDMLGLPEPSKEILDEVNKADNIAMEAEWILLHPKDEKWINGKIKKNEKALRLTRRFVSMGRDYWMRDEGGVQLFVDEFTSAVNRRLG